MAETKNETEEVEKSPEKGVTQEGMSVSMVPECPVLTGTDIVAQNLPHSGIRFHPLTPL